VTDSKEEAAPELGREEVALEEQIHGVQRFGGEEEDGDDAKVLAHEQIARKASLLVCRILDPRQQPKRHRLALLLYVGHGANHRQHRAEPQL
jgi:hypothetical protein